MLTKAQKEMLEMMRDKRAYISHWIHGVKYSLMVPGDTDYGTKVKVLRMDWMWALRPFFIEKYQAGSSTKLYYLKEDAEISDKWLQEEQDRIKQAKQEKENEEQRLIDGRKAWANSWMSVGPGPYQIDISGDWPFGGGIYFNGEKIADIHPVHYSTADENFADVLKREENIPHFEAIKEMVRRANNV